MGQLPVWCSWVWFIIAAVLFPIGGLCWILFIFWPYIKWSKRFMIDARVESRNQLNDMTLQTNARMREFAEEFQRTRMQLADALQTLASAQKVAIGVQVLTALVPLFLESVMEEEKKGRVMDVKAGRGRAAR